MQVPDTITINTEARRELVADRAHVRFEVESSTPFSGHEAFRRAKEIAEILDQVRAAGLAEERCVLRDVRLETGATLGVRGSACRYSLELRDVSTELLPRVLAILAGAKKVTVSELDWRYQRKLETLAELRAEAVRAARAQAMEVCAWLEARCVVVHKYREVHKDPEVVEVFTRMSSDYSAGRAAAPPELGVTMSNRAEMTVSVQAEFRVAPLDGREP